LQTRPNQEPENGINRLPTVLVVEDHVLIRHLISEEFRAANFNVVEAVSLEEALIVLHGRDPVHLVVTDVAMVGPTDGLILAQTVRTVWPELNIKIIIVSGNLPGKSWLDNADAFFAKPYDLDEMVKRARHLLGIDPA